MEGKLVIKIVGVGTGGCHAVDHMYLKGISGVDFVFIDTHPYTFGRSDITEQICLSTGLTEGPYDPEMGRKAAEESREEIAAALQGADMVIIVAGMGGSIGAGAAPVVAEIAQSIGSDLTVGVAARPFKFEGEHWLCRAQEGIALFKEKVDSLVVISNEHLLRTLKPKITLANAFTASNEVLYQAAQGLCDPITRNCLISFADFVSLMKNAGLAHIGVGQASGENKVEKAAKEAMSSSLLELPVGGAQRILVSFLVPPDVDLKKLDNVASMIFNAAPEDVNFIWVAAIVESPENIVRVTVFATDFAD